jgi:hypothetical protein
MSTAYQKELHDIKEYCGVYSCLTTRTCKIKGIKVDIHSGMYDNEFITYAILPVSMFKEEALNKFVVSKSTQLGDYLYIFSKGEKSLKDIIRKNMKESV